MIFGFLLVAAGVLYLLRPQRQLVSLLFGLGIVTMGSGVLSFCVGIVHSLHCIMKVPPANQFKFAALGCAESLHNVVLALMLIVSTALIASGGSLRRALGAGQQPARE